MQLCVALDLPSKKENLSLIKKIKSEPVWLKVGLRSYIRDGRDFLEEIKSIHPESKIFLDLKLYDIPNTMADAAESICEMPVDMFNVHASAGMTAMQTVMKRIDAKKRPLVLAVTALTSFENSEFSAIYENDIKTKADQFARDTHQAGLDGVVCSVHESLSIKEQTSDTFLTLTPGIRPAGSSSDDQKRIATPRVALENRSDFIVVGRPIYQSSNPLEIIQNIHQEIAL
jgi:orotidine-5'-phosphate decarboxylase